MTLLGIARWLVGPIGRWLLLALAVAGALWWAVAAIRADATADAQADIRDRLSVAREQARAAQDRRNADAERIADETRAEAQAESQRIQKETATSSEKVRVVMQKVEVPVNCPTTLPTEVEDEGRAAVEKANKANGS